MSDQLSAKDWLDQGLKALASRGFTALKAEPLAKAMGVSRGSFYWHFADVAAFHAAILARWHEVAAEQIIANVEAASKDENPLALLLRRVFGERLMLERAVRTWASVDSAARAAVQAIDRRRLNYVEGLLAQSGLSVEIARARAQILYWRFSALRYRISRCRRRDNRPWSTNWCGCQRHDTSRSCIVGITPIRRPQMNATPERLDSTVDPKLLEILVCPVTKGPLEFDSTRQELISRSAKLAYPIRDGIPIMLPEEARKIE